MAKITLFAQVIQKLPKELIKSLAKKHGTDKYAKGFNTWSHLVSMIFCQFADCVSLREISNGLHSANGNLNHLGIARAPSKSNIAYQNEHRSCAFFRDCYYALLNYFGQQISLSGRKFRFKMPVYALDSTIITLCAEVYDWARYTHAKGAVKLHTLLNFRTLLPEYVHITDGKAGDNTAARNVEVKPGSIVVCDRGYFDTLLLKLWDSMKVFFVVRVKDNLLYERIEERDLPYKAHPEVLIDEIVRLTGNETAEQYAEPIRRIAVYNALHHFTMVLLTNNMTLAAGTIADLYKARWDIEIFFYDKFIIMQSKVRSIPDNQIFVRLLLTSTSHNNSQCPRSLSQSRRSLLFSHSLSESRLGTRSAYAFSRASRLAFESALA